MKRLILGAFAALLSLSCAACSAQQAPEPPAALDTSKMKNICELAVLECRYHTVAKYDEKDASGFWLWKKDKTFWIEYSGIVQLGVDISKVDIQQTGTAVTISLPPIEVKSCIVDPDSLSKDSFFVAKDSAVITAEDEVYAFSKAQEYLSWQATQDYPLMQEAMNRTKELLESFVSQCGALYGVEYEITWEHPPLSPPAPSPAP